MMQAIEMCSSCNKVIGSANINLSIAENDPYKYTLIARVCGDCRRTWNKRKAFRVVWNILAELRNIKM